MRILFLDDDYTRHAQFKYNRMGEDVVIVQVWSYAEAVLELTAAAELFDVAYLDHDLELNHTSMQRCPNGVDVAKFIVSLPPERRPRKIIIHSWNAMGRLMMHQLLTEVGVDTEVTPFNAAL